MSDTKSRLDSEASVNAPADSEAGIGSAVRAMTSIGHLAGGVVHEINNMLMVLRGNLELIDDCEDEDELKQRVTSALEASSDIAALAQRLNEFSRDDGVWPETLDLNEVTRAGIERFVAEVPAESELRQTLAAEVWPVRADPEKAATAIFELIRFVHTRAPEAEIDLETGNALVPGSAAGQGPGQFVRVKVAGDPSAVPDDKAPKLSSLRRRLIALGSAFGFARQSGGFLDADPKGHWAALYLPRDDTPPDS